MLWVKYDLALNEITLPLDYFPETGPITPAYLTEIDGYTVPVYVPVKFGSGYFWPDIQQEFIVAAPEVYTAIPQTFGSTLLLVNTGYRPGIDTTVRALTLTSTATAVAFERPDESAPGLETDQYFGYSTLDYVWRLIGIFTTKDDSVDFNSLDQSYADSYKYLDLYNALSGNDVVTLPDNAQLPGGTIWSTSFSRFFNAGEGDDIIHGGKLDDYIDGGPNNDTIDGGDGADVIADFSGQMTDIDAGAGDDKIGIKNFSSGTIDGGSGKDLLGVSEDVDLSNLTISNIQTFETNGHTITGRANQFEAFDTIEISETGIGTGVDQSGAVHLNLAVSGGATSLDLSDALKGPNGSRGAFVTGSSDDETIIGGADKDTIDGGSGKDILSGGGGDDNLSGGPENDIISGITWQTASKNGTTVESGENIISGGDGVDTVRYWNPAISYSYEVPTFEKFINSDPTSDFKLKVMFGGDSDTILKDVEQITFRGQNTSFTDLQTVAMLNWVLGGIVKLGISIAPESAGGGLLLASMALFGKKLVTATYTGDTGRGVFVETVLTPVDLFTNEFVNLLGNAPDEVKQKARDTLSALRDYIANSVSDLYDSIKIAQESFFDAAGRATQTLQGEIGNIFDDAFKFMQETFKPQIELTEQAASPLPFDSGGATATVGQVLHGYVSGALVFSDINGNHQLDNGEPSTITNPTGDFILIGEKGGLVAVGGIDASTNLRIEGSLLAPSGYSVISPLTTLVSILELKGSDVATESVLHALGLSESLDLSTLNPVASARAGDIIEAAAEVAAAKVYTTVSLIGSALTGVGGELSSALNSGFSAIAASIAEDTLNLADANSIASIITAAAQASGVILAVDAVSNLAAIIVAGNAAMDNAAQSPASGDALLDAVAAIELALQGAGSDAIHAAAGDVDALAAIKAAFTGTNLEAVISQAAAHLASDGENQSPTSFDSAVTTSEDNPVNGLLSAVDIDNSVLTYQLVAQAVHGSVQVNGNRFTYTPSDNFNGTDTFTFSANDGSLDSNIATITISVDPVNDPASIGGAVTGAVTEDKVLSAIGQLTISDVDDNESSFQAGTIKGGFGNLALATDGKWTYTLDNANAQVQALNNGQSLTDVLSVKSVDGTSADITITINGTDDIVANIINGTQRGEKIAGTDGDDQITPLGGTDFVDAGKGNDVIKATINDGADFYNGGAGSDTVDYSALTQGVTVKLSNIFGLSGGIVTGRQSGTDLLTSIENVTGSQAADSITGNKLANVIEGSGGNDRLTGAGGSDTFVFDTGFGKDVVTDFSVSGPTHDILQFSTDLFADWTSIETAISDTAKGAVITTVAGDTITLVDVTKADLVDHHADDFLFA